MFTARLLLLLLWPILAAAEESLEKRPSFNSSSEEPFVFADGQGLPPGQGDVQQGQALYQQYCQHCHGAKGSGGYAGELAGGHGLDMVPPDKNIGSYWPYAPTLFDFIRRSMPLDKPTVLQDGELYAITAYLLHLNGLLPADGVLDAERLSAIRMPATQRFIAVEGPTAGR